MSTETPAAPVTEQPKANPFDAARAAVAQSEKDQGAAPVSDDTPPDTQPTEEAEKVADQLEETTEDSTDAILSTEELAALPPQERKKAEKWVAKLTRQSQEMSATKKEYEEWKTLIDALKNDPDAAIRQLAERRGLKFQEAPPQDTTAPIPEELKFLEPIFAAREKAIKAELEAKYGRLEERVDTMSAEAAAAETESTMATFDAKYPGWKKHEARMLELGQEFIPAKPMSDFKYMEHLYTLATAKMSEAEQTKKVVEKINKAVASSEPVQSGVPNHRVEIHVPTDPTKRTIREAYEAAKRGEKWVR